MKQLFVPPAYRYSVQVLLIKEHYYLA